MGEMEKDNVGMPWPMGGRGEEDQGKCKARVKRGPQRQNLRAHSRRSMKTCHSSDIVRIHKSNEGEGGDESKGENRVEDFPNFVRP